MHFLHAYYSGLGLQITDNEYYMIISSSNADPKKPGYPPPNLVSRLAPPSLASHINSARRISSSPDGHYYFQALRKLKFVIKKAASLEATFAIFYSEKIFK